MPRYDYVCENCSHELSDVFQSFKEDALTQCPECGKSTLSRVIYGGLGTFIKNTNTIGQLADKNWSNMGHYKRSEIEQERKDSQPENPIASLGPASRKQISKMSEQQKQKYIMTGEV
jgi:putative FmdB family regulatory protein